MVLPPLFYLPDLIPELARLSGTGGWQKHLICQQYGK